MQHTGPGSTPGTPTPSRSSPAQAMNSCWSRPHARRQRRGMPAGHRASSCGSWGGMGAGGGAWAPGAHPCARPAAPARAPARRCRGCSRAGAGPRPPRWARGAGSCTRGRGGCSAGAGRPTQRGAVGVAARELRVVAAGQQRGPGGTWSSSGAWKHPCGFGWRSKVRTRCRAQSRGSSSACPTRRRACGQSPPLAGSGTATPPCAAPPWASGTPSACAPSRCCTCPRGAPPPRQ
jgi:hypothetical protein